MEQKQIVYIGPVMLDEPEMFSLDEFVRQAIALEAERLFYSNGRLFLIDYETLHGIIDGKFVNNKIGETKKVRNIISRLPTVFPGNVYWNSSSFP